MSDQASHPDLSERVRREMRAVVQRVVGETGGESVTRPLVSGEPGSPSAHDAEPLAGVRVARAAELAAHALVCRYIRAAREDGHTWASISTSLGLTVDDVTGGTVAAAAFSYAAGPPDSHWNRTYGPSVTWRCPACGALIRDRGPYSAHPVDCEPGHAEDCPRLAAAVAAYEAEWDDED